MQWLKGGSSDLQKIHVASLTVFRFEGTECHSESQLSPGGSVVRMHSVDVVMDILVIPEFIEIEVQLSCSCNKPEQTAVKRAVV